LAGSYPDVEQLLAPSPAAVLGQAPAV